MNVPFLQIFLLLLVLTGCGGPPPSGPAEADPAEIPATFINQPVVEPREIPAETFQALLPLHRVKTPPGPYDWLATQPEPGQPFSEFTASHPAQPDTVRPYIDVVLLGDFSPVQRRVMDDTVRFMEAFFQRPVRLAGEIPLDVIPDSARRVHPQTGDPQILSTYVIENVMVPRRRPDAFATIAFTTSDLWPGAGWNFVFGQASPDDQVGVWSLYRNGAPQDGEEAFDLARKRAIKTGTHEVAHMFGLPHCIYYECALNGSNHREESDRRPVWLCPVCLRKLAWSLDLDLLARYKALADISREFGWDAEAKFYEESLQSIGVSGY